MADLERAVERLEGLVGLVGALRRKGGAGEEEGGTGGRGAGKEGGGGRVKKGRWQANSCVTDWLRGCLGH